MATIGRSDRLAPGTQGKGQGAAARASVIDGFAYHGLRVNSTLSVSPCVALVALWLAVSSGANGGVHDTRRVLNSMRNSTECVTGRASWVWSRWSVQGITAVGRA
jgi:hypothetical protein